MSEPDSPFPDDVPTADAAEQWRSAADSPDDDDAARVSGEVPLEASPADWQEQQETVIIDDGYEEPGFGDSG